MLAKGTEEKETPMNLIQGKEGMQKRVKDRKTKRVSERFEASREKV